MESEALHLGEGLQTPLFFLSLRQTLKYRVDSRANRSGDGRVLVEVTSDSITTPIVQQESTIVQ